MRVPRFAILAVLLSCCLTISSGAQQSTPELQATLDRLSNISNALQLTADQRQQILPILRLETPQIQQLMNNRAMTSQQREMQLTQLAADVDGKIQPILTQEQWQKWQTVRKQEREDILQKANEK